MFLPAQRLRANGAIFFSLCVFEPHHHIHDYNYIIYILSIVTSYDYGYIYTVYYIINFNTLTWIMDSFVYLW